MHETALFIQQVGFPVFVAMVLLLRVDRMHTENIRAIGQLTLAIQLLHQSLIDANKKPEGNPQ